MTGCSTSLISDLCKQGKLDAIRSTNRSPWWIKADATEIRKIAQEIHPRHKRRSLEQLSPTFVFVGKEGIIET
jgi:hypothetical protein